MPNRTDDPPRTRSEIPAVPVSAGKVATSPGASPEASPEAQATHDHPLTHELFRAILSNNERAGRWEAADEIEVRAIFGEVTLDFTRAELPPSGVVEIDALSFCGEVTIIVPDGAEIELDGTPILGRIEQQVHKKRAREWIRELVTGERDEDLPAPSSHNEPPYFRIEGRAILGGIKVIGR